MSTENPFGLSDADLRLAKAQYKLELKEKDPAISDINLTKKIIEFFKPELNSGLKEWLIKHKFIKEEVKILFGLDEETLKKAKSKLKMQTMGENRGLPPFEKATIACEKVNKLFSSENKELKKWLQKNGFLPDEEKQREEEFIQNIIVQLIVSGLSRKEAEEQAKNYLVH